MSGLSSNCPALQNKIERRALALSRGQKLEAAFVVRSGTPNASPLSASLHVMAPDQSIFKTAAIIVSIAHSSPSAILFYIGYLGRASNSPSGYTSMNSLKRGERNSSTSVQNDLPPLKIASTFHKI